MVQMELTITHDLLARAIKNKMGVTDEIADDISYRVLNYFGNGVEIIDNALDQDDRRLFYFLQDVQILSTHWEEQILPTGRTWRVFYWTLNMDKIRKAVQPIAEEHVPELGIYESLPENVWSREAV